MMKADYENLHHYNRNLRRYAHSNRSGMTRAEACMWKYIIGRQQLAGYRFRRQRPVLNYIVDFVCFRLKLVIEVDGGYHGTETMIKRDRIRDERLRAAGFTVLRFSNQQVIERRAEVIEVLHEWIRQSGAEPAPPRRSRGRGVRSRRRKSRGGGEE